MEEVDGIIVHSLRAIGCEIREDIQSLTEFTTELIVEATARCVRIIKNDSDLPHKLPPSMSAKFRVGTSLADTVKELGYRGEVGYQTFLYSNASDIRKVFIFLLEKMPKESSQSTEETLGASVLLQRTIANEVARRISSPWVPPYCKKLGICWRGNPPIWQRQGSRDINNFNACPLEVAHGLHDFHHKISKETIKYYNAYLPYMNEQPPEEHQLVPSVLELNAKKFAAQQEWENEWNHFGLASRLTPEEYKTRKKQKLQKKISNQLSDCFKKQHLEVARGLDDVINSTGEKTKTKGSRFTHIEKLQYAQAEDQSEPEPLKIDTEEELQQKREEELVSLKTELENVADIIEQLQLEIKKYNAGQKQMDEEMHAIEKENESKKESFKVKKKTMDLLPDADNNVSKLQSLVDSSAQRLVNLAKQWENHRAPLIDQYRELKCLTENRESEVQKKLEEIKRLRERMKEVAADAKTKEELYKQLVAEYERMGKDVNRAAYTKRILEIVGNIKKQKHDIDKVSNNSENAYRTKFLAGCLVRACVVKTSNKVLIDTKSLQKEINQLTGKLERTFTVTDELIFRDAKKDDSVRKAYKFLAALHENCNSVINTVEETGVILREIRDLEDQIEQEGSGKVMDNLEKITIDYQQMRKENAVLITKYKKQQES